MLPLLVVLRGKCKFASFLFLFVFLDRSIGLLFLYLTELTLLEFDGAGSGAAIRWQPRRSCDSSEDDEELPTVLVGPLATLLGAAIDLDFLFAVFAEP